MKRFLILCAFCAFLRPIYAANEINAFAPGVTTAYAVVRQVDGDVWYPTGQVFEVWGTGARTAADYDIALTDKSGDMFVGNFDTNIAAQFCHIVTHYQAGAGPADTDPAIWQEYGYWSGTTWQATTMTAATIADTVWDETMSGHIGETTFGGELQTLDPNITLILADTSAYDTDAEHAAAIWNAAIASYGTAGTYGEELEDLDPNITAIKAVTDVMQAVNSTVSVVGDANNFTIANTGDINDVNGAYEGMTVYVEDATTGDWEDRLIENWETGRVITVDTDFTFTPEVGDIVIIWGTSYFPPRVYDNIPLERHTTTETVDRRVSTGGGTTTLDEVGDDPP